MLLRQLRYFVAVAEELHFRNAAARLRLSQPSLSHQIRSLEAAIKVRLFERTKRRVTLTPAGQELLGEARRLLNQLEHTILLTQQVDRGETGVLSIGFVPATDYAAFPRILPVFRKRCPRVQLSLRAMPTLAQMECLLKGTIDVGFVRPPVNDPLLALEPLIQEPLVVALPQMHHLRKRRAIPLRALAKEQYIFFPREMAPSFYDLVASSCRQAGFTLRVTHSAEQYLTILGLIASGLGLALVPSSLRSIDMRGVCYRPLVAPAPRVDLSMIHRRDNTSQLVQSFLDTAREVMRPAAD